jgi:hypothetical protein
MSEQERIKELEKENALLKSRLKMYETPADIRSYYVGQKVLNQQVDYLDRFDFAKEIGVSPKEDKVYDRAMDVFEKLTGNATKLNNLRKDFGLTGDEGKDVQSMKKMVSPESVAQDLGDYKTHDV